MRYEELQKYESLYKRAENKIKIYRNLKIGEMPRLQNCKY